jgi:hypothetical protein
MRGRIGVISYRVTKYLRRNTGKLLNYWKDISNSFQNIKNYLTFCDMGSTMKP